MLCPSVFQPSPVHMGPFLDLRWPVRSLWPETRPLFFHVEQEMIRHMQEMRQSLEHMEKLHQRIFDQIDQPSSSSSSSSSVGAFRPISFQDLGRDGAGTGAGFGLSLDTAQFSPDELSVKQVGRKLRVSGRTERKQDDGKGSYSYRCQEFRQEVELPDGVDPEAVSCSLVGGRLQIQAPRDQAPKDGKERIVPISVASAPAITSSTSSSSTSTSGDPEGRSSTPAETNSEKN